MDRQSKAPPMFQTQTTVGPTPTDGAALKLGSIDKALGPPPSHATPAGYEQNGYPCGQVTSADIYQPAGMAKMKNAVPIMEMNGWQPPPMLSPWELHQKTPPTIHALESPQIEYCASAPAFQQPALWTHSKSCQCFGCATVKAQLDAAALDGHYENYPPNPHDDYIPAGSREIYSDPKMTRQCEYMPWEWQRMCPLPPPVVEDQKPPHTNEVKKKPRTKRSNSALNVDAKVKKEPKKRRRRVGARDLATSPQGLAEIPQLQTPPISESPEYYSSGGGGACGQSSECPDNSDSKPKSRTQELTPTETVTESPTSHTNSVRSSTRFSMEEECVMMKLREEGLTWADIASLLPMRRARNLQVHYSSALKSQYTDWEPEQDHRLVWLVNQHERAMWDAIADRFGSDAIKGVACRYRYMLLHDHQTKTIEKWIEDQKNCQRWEA